MSKAKITRAAAIAWVAELFNEDASALSPATKREEITMWDSLGVLSLIADLDEKFGIQLSETDLTATATVKDLLDLLDRHEALEPT